MERRPLNGCLVCVNLLDRTESPSGYGDCFPDSSLLRDTECGQRTFIRTDSPNGSTGKACLGRGLHCPVVKFGFSITASMLWCVYRSGLGKSQSRCSRLYRVFWRSSESRHTSVTCSVTGPWWVAVSWRHYCTIVVCEHIPASTADSMMAFIVLLNMS